MKKKYKDLIKQASPIAGGAIFLLVLFSVSFLSPYAFDDFWENYNGTPLLVQRDNDYHILIPNEHTDYTRYSVRHDWTTVYAKKRIVAKFRYKPYYYKTYGKDEWIELMRKATKIETNHQQVGNKMLAFKRTPFYAYDYYSGTGGTLTEQHEFFGDIYKTTLYFNPVKRRRDNKHKIEWEIELDDDTTCSIDFQNKLKCKHRNNPITIDYSGGKVLNVSKTKDTIVITYECGKGVCTIDPSIKVAITQFEMGLPKTPRWDSNFSDVGKRVGILIKANSTNNYSANTLVNQTLNLNNYIDSGTLDNQSIGITEHTWAGGVASSNISYNLGSSGSGNCEASNAKINIFWKLTSNIDYNQSAYYYVYFDILGGRDEANSTVTCYPI